MDVGKMERNTKRKVEKAGGMGYIDMKLALYGVPESGTLSLWLPYEGPPHDHSHDDDLEADHWFDSLVVCEVNEKRGDDECKMESDLRFVVGGVESGNVTKITSTASYLKKDVCVNVEIPKEAKVTRRKDSIKPEDTAEGHDNGEGLAVDITVIGKAVTRSGGACSISHVVWEQH